MAKEKKDSTAEDTTTITVSSEQAAKINVKEFQKELNKFSRTGAVLKIVSRFEDIAIKYARLTKAFTIECAYIDVHKDRRNEIVQKSDAISHEDLRLAFRALRIHLAKLCDLREAYGLDFDQYEEEQMRLEKPATYLDPLDGIKVTGFSITTGDDGEGVTITGTKQIGNKVLSLTSPFTKFDDLEYAHSDSLQMYVLYVADEVKEYLNGKVAMKQLDMFEDTDEAGSKEAAGF